MPLALTAFAALAAAFALNGSGRFVFRKLFGDEAYLPGLGFPLGFAVASCAVTFFAACGIYSRALAIAIGLLLLAVAGVDASQRRRGEESLFNDRFAWSAVFITAALIVPALLIAAAPAVVRDALVYHLPITESFLRTGSWAPAAGDLYDYFPSGAEAVFTILFAVFGEKGAAAVHVASVAALTGLLFTWLREPYGSKAAYVAAVACATTPLTGVFGGAAYVDFVQCLFVAAAMMLIDRASAWERPSLMGAAGVMAGMTVATKYTGLVLALVLTIPVLMSVRRPPSRRVLAFLGAWAVGGLVAGAPFLLRNLALTGNPVFPFAYSIFGGPGWDLERAASFDIFLRSFGAGRTLGDLALLPLRVSLLGRFGTPYFDGALGPYALALLIIAPASIAFRRSAGPSGFGLAALAGWAAFAAGTHQARFALPVLVLAAPSAASVAERLFMGNRPMRFVAAVLAGACVAVSFSMSYSVVAGLRPFHAAVSSSAAEEYRARRIPGYGAFQYLKTHAKTDDAVFAAMTGNFRYASPIRFDSDCVFEDARLQTMLGEARGPADVARRFAREGWTYFFFDAVRLNNALDERKRALLVEFLRRHGRVVARDEPFLLARIEPTPP